MPGWFGACCRGSTVPPVCDVCSSTSITDGDYELEVSGFTNGSTINACTDCGDLNASVTVTAFGGNVCGFLKLTTLHPCGASGAVTEQWGLSFGNKYIRGTLYFYNPNADWPALIERHVWQKTYSSTQFEDCDQISELSLTYSSSLSYTSSTDGSFWCDGSGSTMVVNPSSL